MGVTIVLILQMKTLRPKGTQMTSLIVTKKAKYFEFSQLGVKLLLAAVPLYLQQRTVMSALEF